MAGDLVLKRCSRGDQGDGCGPDEQAHGDADAREVPESVAAGAEGHEVGVVAQGSSPKGVTTPIWRLPTDGLRSELIPPTPPTLIQLSVFHVEHNSRGVFEN